MAFPCINGARECDGCGGCKSFEDDEEMNCCLCGRGMAASDAYEDLQYSPICLSCLKLIHKL